MTALRTAATVADELADTLDRQPYPRCDHRSDDAGRRITRCRIVTTRTYRYDALEPTNGHATLTHDLDQWWSPFYSRPLPAAIDAMKPASDERIAAVRAWRAAIAAEARAAIHATFPELESMPHKCATDGSGVSACEWTAP